MTINKQTFTFLALCLLVGTAAGGVAIVLFGSFMTPAQPVYDYQPVPLVIVVRPEGVTVVMSK